MASPTSADMAIIIPSFQARLHTFWRWIPLHFALVLAACASTGAPSTAAQFASAAGQVQFTDTAAATTAMTVAAAPADFDAWLLDLRAEATTRGISVATLDAAFAGVQPIARIIELDRNQPESTITFDTYAARIVSADRVRKGRELLARNGAVLRRVGAQFGVQPRFIVALWGIESNFGANTGGFGVIPALATLAYDARRADFFRRELIDALTIIEEGHIAAGAMTGSWAGAMGQSQFMPSSFRQYAIDFDGDGVKDIWNNLPDIFASAANFLHSVGWQPTATWGREVLLPQDFDPSLAGLDIKRDLASWQAIGVRKIDGGDLPGRNLISSILLPDGPGGRAFIIYDNFRATLNWNRSFYFATSVGLLSDAIAN